MNSGTYTLLSHSDWVLMLKKILTTLSILLVTSCGTIMTTSSDKVSRSDTNKVLVSDLGVVIDVIPVRIKIGICANQKKCKSPKG